MPDKKTRVDITLYVPVDRFIGGRVKNVKYKDCTHVEISPVGDYLTFQISSPQGSKVRIETSLRYIIETIEP